MSPATPGGLPQPASDPCQATRARRRLAGASVAMLAGLARPATGHRPATVVPGLLAGGGR